MDSDQPSHRRLLDRLLALSGASLLAYLLASHTVRSFLADTRRMLEKAIAVLGGS